MNSITPDESLLQAAAILRHHLDVFVGKRAIGLTERELVLLDGYFWDETKRQAFIYEINVRLGYGDGVAEQILKKLERAAGLVILKRNA